MRNSSKATGISATVGSNWITPQYDPAGNMTTIPQPKDPTKPYTAVYDAWNRLVRLTAPAAPPESSSSSSSSASSVSSALNSSSSSSSTSSSSSSEPEEVLIAEYEYDARRFRIRERTYTEGVPSETRDVYFTESWQAIEERVPPQTFPWAERQYVWGTRYIDDCVLRDRFPLGGSPFPDQRLYALQDANWNVIAITDDEGAVQERYAYTAYGETTFLLPDFTVQIASSLAWQTLYGGYRYDTCTHLLSVRRRSYYPCLGIWTIRDFKQYDAARDLYAYADASPLTNIDPSGLAASGVIRFIYKVNGQIVKVVTKSSDSGKRLLQHMTDRAAKGQRAREGQQVFVQCKDPKRLAEEVSPHGKSVYHPLNTEGHPGHYHPVVGESAGGRPITTGTPHIGSDYTGKPLAGMAAGGVGSESLTDIAGDVVEIIVDLTPAGDIKTIIVEGPEIYKATDEALRLIREHAAEVVRLRAKEREVGIRRFIEQKACPCDDKPLRAGDWRKRGFGLQN